MKARIPSYRVELKLKAMDGRSSYCLLCFAQKGLYEQQHLTLQQ